MDWRGIYSDIKIIINDKKLYCKYNVTNKIDYLHELGILVRLYLSN